VLRCLGSADAITLSYVVATTRSTVTPPCSIREVVRR
jgi:hypothetical protein